MSIHPVDKNVFVENVIIEYRDCSQTIKPSSFSAQLHWY